MGIEQDIDQLSRMALDELMKLLKAGMSPQQAVEQVLSSFNERYVPALAAAMGVALGFSVASEALAQLEIGGLKLSDRLYANAREVSQVVMRTLNEHFAQLESAHELALKIYEGYGFAEGEDPLKVARRELPRYLYQPLARIRAAKLKTPALRAAYMEWLVAAEKQHTRALRNKLRVALEERARYYAKRIAVTELHRAQSLRKAADYLEQDSVRYVRVKLSATHPKYDICDYHAKLNAFGLGPGVYPKDKVPVPPFHPWCRCTMLPVRTPRKVGRAQSERDFMMALPFERRRDILGSFERARRYGEDRTASVLEMVDALKPDEYRTMSAKEAVRRLEKYRVLNAGISDADALAKWLRQARGERLIAIGALTGVWVPEFEARSNLLLLSAATAEKQRRRHPDIDHALYAAVEAMIENAEAIVLESKRTLVVFSMHQGRLYKLVIKRTADGSELFVLSLHRTTRAHMRNVMARGQRIR